MLIKCPECDLQASDKASSCPHCGYPFQTNSEPRKVRKSNKRRRLPNGFGQISEIKNRNLRNPFRAMVTVGKTDTGRPICKPLQPNAFFPTYNDAYAALVEYNRNPYDLDPGITMLELYDKWSTEHFKKNTSDSTVRMVKSAWAYCSELYNMKVSDIRLRHIKGCVNNGRAVVKGVEKGPSANMQKRIKSICNQMLDYAVEYELVERNYAREYKIDKEISKEASKTKKEHISFTDEEMTKLWDNLYKRSHVDVILIQCYSGWRPQELLNIKVKDVDIKNWIFTGGMKSDAGKNRTVPIHTKIRELVKYKLNEAIDLNSRYMFNCLDSEEIRYTYAKYQDRFEDVVQDLELNVNHRPHDPRKQFVTMAKRYNVDEYAIKYMAGHVINDVTERIYTTRSIEWLREELEKIK